MHMQTKLQDNQKEGRGGLRDFEESIKANEH